MPAVAAPPEQRILLANATWETYERLLAENVTCPGTRFAYDEGMLEIMVVYVGHEAPNRTLASLVGVVAEVLRLDMVAAGSTTFKRQDLEKGFEPDSCFYFRNVDLVRGKEQLDMEVDPPPDLVIEVDITRSSLNRFRIFAAIGVAEVWRFDGEKVRMYVREEGQYKEVAASAALPVLTAAQAGIFLDEQRRQKWPDWIDDVRSWVRFPALAFTPVVSHT